MQTEVTNNAEKIRLLEARLASACPPHVLRHRMQAERAGAAAAADEAMAARASAASAQDVIDQYQREVTMLKAALEVHAEEFTQSGKGGPHIHSSLIMAVAEVCCGTESLVAHVAATNRCSRHICKTSP
jgi:hypothetical protein